MSALLKSIIFEKRTCDYLSECMRERPEDDFSPTMVDEFRDLGRDRFRLKGLSDGDYTLLIGTSLERHTTATLTLMHAETHDVVTRVNFDIQPLIQSAITHFDEYSAAAEAFDPTEENPIIDAIEKKRMACLQDVLKPYITSERFQAELLTVFDFVTGYYVEEKMMSTDQDFDPTEDKPGTFYIPGSKLLN